MTQLLNAIYGLALTFLLPWILVRSWMTGRYRKGIANKLLGLSHSPVRQDKPIAWFHGVSVGEIHLLGTVVAAFRRRHPDWQCVISTTTDTGISEAQKRFPDLPVIVWPFDFSWAVRRTLDRLQPSLIVLAESELWPNFLKAANERRIPVLVINGRMSPRSLKRYQKLQSIVKPLLFDHITAFGMQTEAYALAMCQLGINPSKIQVTGSVKYDGASSDRQHPKIEELRRLFGFTSKDRVWVAGSTHAPEEKRILEVFRHLRVRHPQLRLILVPRSPDRFEEVAKLIQQQSFSLARRSQIQQPLRDEPALILIDTVGELSAVWGLADIGFVGGSLDGNRGGQSMIEPAALGVPVLFGPHVWNFRDAVQRLLEANAAIQIESEKSLENEIHSLLIEEERRKQMSLAARKMVQQQQGATDRTINLIDQILGKQMTQAA